MLIEPHCSVQSIEAGSVTLSDGRTFESDTVILACGLQAAKRLLSSVEDRPFPSVEPLKASTIDALLASSRLETFTGSLMSTKMPMPWMLQTSNRVGPTEEQCFQRSWLNGTVRTAKLGCCGSARFWMNTLQDGSDMSFTRANNLKLQFKPKVESRLTMHMPRTGSCWLANGSKAPMYSPMPLLQPVSSAAKTFHIDGIEALFTSIQSVGYALRFVERERFESSHSQRH